MNNSDFYKSSKDYWKCTLMKTTIAGMSCAITSAILNPVDVTKIRMQNQSNITPEMHKGFYQEALKILKNEGFIGWSRGLPASMYRELLYSSIRIGAYEPIRSTVSGRVGSSKSPVVKYSSALMSGFIGSFAANPFDLVKTRFQAIMPWSPDSQKILSTSTSKALYDIYLSQGIKGLYTGWQLTTLRAAVLTSAQLGSYDSIKNNVFIDTLKFENGFVVHFWVSLLAGIITTTAANPVDVVKTRFLADSSRKYKSPWDCAMALVKSEGFRGFCKGWTPAYCRIGPHTIISFVLIEKIRCFFGLPPI